MQARWLVACALVLAGAAAFGQDVAAPAPLTRIAFGSCNREYKPQPLWKPILESKPDLWIWLGDIVYGDADNLPKLAQRYQSQKEHGDYKALRDQSKVIGVWDDNDFGLSNGGSTNQNKDESARLLLDFLEEPAESARRKQSGVYAAYTFGPVGRQVKVVLLDGRYHRERPGATADILGEEQWRWLEQELTSSSADIHLIGSGMQVIASEHRYEKWANFPKARARLFDLLAKTKARNVIFLSGDRHLGEISRLTDPRIAQPLYDVTSSGMTHHAEGGWFRDFKKETNRFRLGQNFVALNFGLLEIDWDASPPVVTARIRGVDNSMSLEEKITLAPPETGNR